MSNPARGSLDEPSNLVDLFVGARVRQRRMVLGLQEQDLALMAGITTEMLARLEAGTERIGAPRLHQLGQLLNVPISWFFSGLDADGEVQFGGMLPSPAQASGPARDAEMLLVLQHCFKTLTSQAHKLLVVDLARKLADIEASRHVDNSERN